MLAALTAPAGAGKLKAGAEQDQPPVDEAQAEPEQDGCWYTRICEVSECLPFAGVTSMARGFQRLRLSGRDAARTSRVTTGSVRKRRTASSAAMACGKAVRLMTATARASKSEADDRLDGMIPPARPR